MENNLTPAMRECLIRTSMDMNGLTREQAEEHWGNLGEEFEAELVYLLKMYRESEEE